MKSKQQSRRRSLRVVAYLGNERPLVETDYAEMLIEGFLSGPHQLLAVVTERKDPVNHFLKSHGVLHIELLPELSRVQSEIKRVLMDPGFSAQFDRWCRHIRNLNADIGVTIWSQWIPPQIYSIPPLGFINFHPAPLPKLRGMEPDTFAILNDMKSIFGTVHRINEEFDCGDIVRRTKHVPIKSYDTPLSILEKLNREGVKSVIKSLDDLASGSIHYSAQIDCHSTDATREMARREAYIDWNNDDCHKADLRFRAFCGQDIGIRLKAYIRGELFEIIDMETHHTKISSVLGLRPGSCCGIYSGEGKFLGADIIALPDGVAVVRSRGPIVPFSDASVRHPESLQSYCIDPVHHCKETDLAQIKKDIHSFVLT